MMIERFYFGPLAVDLDAHSGQPVAVTQRVAEPGVSPNAIFRPEYIQTAVAKARMAWESLADR